MLKSPKNIIIWKIKISCTLLQKQLSIIWMILPNNLWKYGIKPLKLENKKESCFPKNLKQWVKNKL